MKLPTTLSELKRLNSESENTDEHETEVLESEEQTPAGEQNSSDKDDHENSLNDDDVDQAEHVPAWMLTGEEELDKTSSDDVQVPLKAHIAQRKKFQGNISSLRSDIEERDTQIEALTNTVNELKNAITPQSKANGHVPNTDLPPVLSDFNDEDNPEAAHQSALLEWSMRNFEARQQNEAAKKRAQEAAQKREAELTSHYQRAAMLVDAGELTPDEYRAADAFVRQAVENSRPGEGKTIFNTLFADVGKGSEKVVISLYKNATNLNQLQRELERDISGLKAATFLGRLAADFERESSQSAISSAPKPGSKVKGGVAPVTKTDKQALKLKKEYDKAHASGDFGAAFSAKKKARAHGVDVSRWAYD